MPRMTVVEFACIVAIAVAMVELPRRDRSVRDAAIVLNEILAVAGPDLAHISAAPRADRTDP